MGALIEKDDLGNWAVKGIKWEDLREGKVITREIADKLYGCLCKLKDYEESGLEPEEVESIRHPYYEGFKEGKKVGYNKAIDDFMNKLCDHCMQQTNECYNLECPFCTDGCDIVKIAEQLKEGDKK